MKAVNLPTFLKSTQKTRRLCRLANVEIVPSPPTFIHRLAIYGLWNGTLSTKINSFFLTRYTAML